MVKEVKSKVYKAVKDKKTGDCVLVKKRRSRKKTKKAKAVKKASKSEEVAEVPLAEQRRLRFVAQNLAEKEGALNLEREKSALLSKITGRTGVTKKPTKSVGSQATVGTTTTGSQATVGTKTSGSQATVGTTTTGSQAGVKQKTSGSQATVGTTTTGSQVESTGTSSGTQTETVTETVTKETPLQKSLKKEIDKLLERFNANEEYLEKVVVRIKEIELENEKLNKLLSGKTKPITKAKERATMNKIKKNDKTIAIQSDLIEETRKELAELEEELNEKYFLLRQADDEAEEQSGQGGDIDVGLFDSEIEKIMKSDKRFKGVVSADQVHTLDITDNCSFIMNLDNSGEPGSHWVACYIDMDDDKEVCYYDSYGRDPSESFVKQITKLVEDSGVPHLLKFKINKKVNQKASTGTCGWMCINFIKAMNAGKSFKEATNYTVGEGEARAEKEAKKFGYI